MRLNLTIRADVVNIETDSPKSGDSFFVDSNIWLFLAYGRLAQGCKPPNEYQIRKYPAYVKRAFQARSRLLRSGFTFAEVAHCIERTEREIWERYNANLSVKEFRHNQPTARTNVLGEVDTAWGVVKSLSMIMDVALDHGLTEAAVSSFKAHPLDGYDVLLSTASTKAGVEQIITDDCDFACVAGLRVFTANKAVLAEAGRQNRLVARRP